MKFFIITFGCKVNICESENIFAAMVKGGFEPVFCIESADIIIINSCSVTAESDRKLRQTIHRVKRVNKSCVLAIMGCLPQAEPEKSKNLVGADIIIGNVNKNFLVDVIKNYLKKPVKTIDIKPVESATVFENTVVNYSPHRSRAFLKIQDGCNRFCSYCIIPFARGRVRSKPLQSIKKDAELFSQNGYKEIVLVGINLSSYGQDLGFDLADAIHTIAEVSGIKRIRLGSLEPDMMTDELIEKISFEKKLCPQFHLSLQSGSDEVLKKMRRRYNREEYLNLIKKLRKAFDGATFTTDIMVGFPGETEKDFEDTISIINKARFLKVHVFPYSVRPGTLAASMKNQIDSVIKSERVKKVIAMSQESSKLILNEFVGLKASVLYETMDESGFYEGYTDNYILVKSNADSDIRGKIVETQLEYVQKNFIQGYLFDEHVNNT